MDTLSARALETAKLKGAQYADIRVVQTTDQSLSVKNGVVDELNVNVKVRSSERFKKVKSPGQKVGAFD